MRFQIKNIINKIGVKKLIDMMITTLVSQNELVTSGIDSTYVENTFLLSDISNEPLREEQEYFESIRNQLKKDLTDQNKYVAILNKKIIGTGDNGPELAIRMYKEHGYVPILVEKVDEDIIYTASPNLE